MREYAEIKGTGADELFCRSVANTELFYARYNSLKNTKHTFFLVVEQSVVPFIDSVTFEKR